MSFAPLQPADGPPCPHCGCRDVKITQHPPEGAELPYKDGGSWWMQGRARCNHCRAQFAFRELPPSIGQAVDEATAEMKFEPADVQPDTVPIPPRDTAYPVRACPECGSPHTEVASSGKKPKPGEPRVRYHKCKDCPATFKSIDRRHLETVLRVVPGAG